MPPPQYVPITRDPVGWFKGLLLPWLVLAMVFMAFYARLTRAQMLETMGEDFIPGRPRQRGLLPLVALQAHRPGDALADHHGLRLDLAGLLSGRSSTESTFNIQGLGRLALTSGAAVRPVDHDGHCADGCRADPDRERDCRPRVQRIDPRVRASQLT